jgi:hypothetical protein
MRNPYAPPTASLEASPELTPPSVPLPKRTLGIRDFLAVSWLAFCGGYTIWYGLNEHYWSLKFIAMLVGGVTVIASSGVLIGWRWSRWAIYAFVVLGSSTWLYVVWGAVRAGHFPLETVQLSALALVPGLSMLFASVWSADTVRRRFRPFRVAA